jgi:hypothetical protein
MRSATFLTASLFAAGLGLALSLPLATAAQANIAIAIDKNTQQMSVAVDGEPRYTWPVSTGRRGYDTPSGTFKINRMDADHFSQEWDNAPMPHSMFFDLHGHAIHGFFDVKHLGLAVSHGCVRLSPAHAATLFDLVKAEGMANTSVVVTGRTPGGNNVPVARSRLPDNETVYNAQPQPLPPQYGQRPPQYQQQPTPEYAERASQFPPQPPPYYGQPAYGQRYYAQPTYGQTGQGYYVQPGYGQPVFRQW